jgi:hypothetical protein
MIDKAWAASGEGVEMLGKIEMWPGPAKKSQG